jgi:hypothetical protein
MTGFKAENSEGISVTVMLDSFFGIHPHVVRSGLWAKMKPGEKDSTFT